uniref:C2H2-type domain-containing protein n=1 Tax=Gasterosteus aculeatus aculeatus TaxID=481459 RepID=A0AAQ4RSC7_GASAC
MLRFRCPWPAGGSGAPSRGGTILINGNVRLLGFSIRSSPSQIITFLLTKSCLNSEAVSPRAKTPQPTLKTHYSYLSHTHFIIAINLTLHTRINTWLVNVFNSGVLHAYLLQTHKEGLKSEPDKEVRDASEPTRDCQMSEVSDDAGRVCGGFDSGGNRKKPWRGGDETADRPHTCSICNKNFRIKSILTRHMKTHTGEKPYSCGVCDKSFIQRSYLHTHMNSHSGKKPHTCSFCGRGFTQVGNMNAHIRIHTGEKPHSCADCGKSFREKADLIKHTIIHTGEKPYVCTVCRMRFSAQSNLTRHTKTHSGERPYSCSSCGKKFIRRSHLLIHMKTHAVERL